MVSRWWTHQNQQLFIPYLYCVASFPFFIYSSWLHFLAHLAHCIIVCLFDFHAGNKTVSFARYGKYFTCDELCAITGTRSTIPLPQGVNNILCAFLGKVKVSTDMISVLLYFKLLLIKGSHSHSAVGVTHLISPSAPSRAGAVQAARLHLPNRGSPAVKENVYKLLEWSHQYTPFSTLKKSCLHLSMAGMS